jgi:hypothetical protein
MCLQMDQQQPQPRPERGPPQKKDAATDSTPAWPVGVFFGSLAPRCEHYARKDWLKSACCDRHYPCRLWHSEAELHKIDLRTTKVVGCSTYGSKEQPEGESSIAVFSSRHTCAVFSSRRTCAMFASVAGTITIVTIVGCARLARGSA